MTTEADEDDYSIYGNGVLRKACEFFQFNHHGKNHNFYRSLYTYAWTVYPRRELQFFHGMYAPTKNMDYRFNVPSFILYLFLKMKMFIIIKFLRDCSLQRKFFQIKNAAS
jgi:hypothetical protein